MKTLPIPYSKSEYASVDWHSIIRGSPALSELIGLAPERVDKQSLVLEAQAAETQLRAGLSNWLPALDPRQWATIRSEISGRAPKPSSAL